jgi:hypothetical protein
MRAVLAAGLAAEDGLEDAEKLLTDSMVALLDGTPACNLPTPQRLVGPSSYGLLVNHEQWRKGGPPKGDSEPQ